MCSKLCPCGLYINYVTKSVTLCFFKLEYTPNSPKFCHWRLWMNFYEPEWVQVNSRWSASWRGIPVILLPWRIDHLCLFYYTSDPVNGSILWPLYLQILNSSTISSSAKKIDSAGSDRKLGLLWFWFGSEKLIDLHNVRASWWTDWWTNVLVLHTSCFILGWSFTGEQALCFCKWWWYHQYLEVGIVAVNHMPLFPGHYWLCLLAENPPDSAFCDLTTRYLDAHTLTVVTIGRVLPLELTEEKVKLEHSQINLTKGQVGTKQTDERSGFHTWTVSTMFNSHVEDNKC